MFLSLLCRCSLTDDPLLHTVLWAGWMGWQWRWLGGWGRGGGWPWCCLAGETSAGKGEEETGAAATQGWEGSNTLKQTLRLQDCHQAVLEDWDICTWLKELTLLEVLAGWCSAGRQDQQSVCSSLQCLCKVCTVTFLAFIIYLQLFSTNWVLSCLVNFVLFSGSLNFIKVM